MNYGEIKNLFVSALKRRNIPAQQIDAWVKQGIQRTQRLLTTPASETVAEFEVVDGFDKLLIPNDLLNIISISVDGKKLVNTDNSTVNELAKHAGNPSRYCREEGFYIIGPRPVAGSIIKVVYYANFAALENDTDENFLTAIAPDIIIAGAMVEACRYFVDPRQASYEEQFTTAIADLNMQAVRDELTNAAISPAYGFNFDD